MPITIYPFPPQLEYSPYVHALYAQFGDEFHIDQRSPRISIWRMMFGRHARVWHIHFFDAIIQRPSKFITWMRSTGWIMLLMFLRWRGVTLVWTVHNAEPHECYHPDIARRTVHHTIKQCHTVITHHYATRTYLNDHYPHNTPIQIIPHGHAKHPFGPLPSRRTARQQLGFDNDTPVFLYLGMIRRYKGIELLIDAMELLPHVHLIVAGHPADRAYLSELHHLTARRINVTLRPRFLPDNEAGVYLAACNALVLPYRNITTSGMLVAAQAAGVVCIVPNLPSLLEQVKDGETGFVYHADHVNSLVNALERAMAHPNTTHLQRQAQQSLANHTWEQIAKQYMELFVSLQQKRSS